MDGLGSFSFRHTLGRLLNLDVLLVREEAHVVLDHKLVLCFAMSTLYRLNDSATLNKTFFLGIAVAAEEGCLLHFRDNISVADDDTAQGYHLIDVLRTKLSYAVGLEEIVRPYLNKNVILLVLVTNNLFASKVVHIKLLVDLGNNKIKDRNQVSWVVFNLSVQLWVVGEDVAAVNVKDLHLHFTHLFELFNVIRHAGKLFVAAIFIDLFYLDEVVDKLLQFLLY